MKNDLFFWCLFVWAFSVLLWGWLLTIQTKWIRDWFGGFAIVCNFFSGCLMCSILFHCSEPVAPPDTAFSFYEFMLDTAGWLFLFAPMFVMRFLLKKTGVGSPLRKIIRPMTSRKIDKTISRGTY